MQDLGWWPFGIWTLRNAPQKNGLIDYLAWNLHIYFVGKIVGLFWSSYLRNSKMALNFQKMFCIFCSINWRTTWPYKNESHLWVSRSIDLSKLYSKKYWQLGDVTQNIIYFGLVFPPQIVSFKVLYTAFLANRPNTKNKSSTDMIKHAKAYQLKTTKLFMRD